MPLGRCTSKQPSASSCSSWRVATSSIAAGPRPVRHCRPCSTCVRPPSTCSPVTAPRWNDPSQPWGWANGSSCAPGNASAPTGPSSRDALPSTTRCSPVSPCRWRSVRGTPSSVRRSTAPVGSSYRRPPWATTPSSPTSPVSSTRPRPDARPARTWPTRSRQSSSRRSSASPCSPSWCGCSSPDAWRRPSPRPSRCSSSPARVLWGSPLRWRCSPGPGAVPAWGCSSVGPRHWSVPRASTPSSWTRPAPSPVPSWQWHRSLDLTAKPLTVDRPRNSFA